MRLWQELRGLLFGTTNYTLGQMSCSSTVMKAQTTDCQLQSYEYENGVPTAISLHAQFTQLYASHSAASSCVGRGKRVDRVGNRHQEARSVQRSEVIEDVLREDVTNQERWNSYKAIRFPTVALNHIGDAWRRRTVMIRKIGRMFKTDMQVAYSRN